nr:ABC transporter ATP-binding protein [Chitinophagaceae bacterium]
MSTSTSTKKIFDFALLGRVFRYVKPYRKAFILSIALAIALALLSPIRPYLIKFMIDEGIVHQSTPTTHWLHTIFSGNNATAFIINLFILQIILLLLETVFRFVFSFIAAWLGQRVVKDLRITVYKKILSLNLSQYDKTPIGTLTTRTINDIESINDIFSDGLIPIIGDILSIFLTLGFMFWMDWKITLISLIPFPLLLIATYYFKESVKKSFTKVRNAIASLNAFVQEHITGMQVVQAFAAEDQEFAKFKTIN